MESKTFVLTVNPRMLKLINEKRFTEIRDYYAEELKRLQDEKALALKSGNRPLYEDCWKRIAEAQRLHDRYYVLSDQQQKGRG